MQEICDVQKRGFYYYRHWGGHSDNGFLQLNWMWNFRRDQSFLALTNRSGYGIEPEEAVNPWDWWGHITGGVNNLYELGWDPDTIVDSIARYEVELTGSGIADVTLRRLQHFEILPGGAYLYWRDGQSGPGTPATADEDGLLTIPGVSGGQLLIIEPEAAAPVSQAPSHRGIDPVMEVRAVFPARDHPDRRSAKPDALGDLGVRHLAPGDQLHEQVVVVVLVAAGRRPGRRACPVRRPAGQAAPFDAAASRPGIDLVLQVRPALSAGDHPDHPPRQPGAFGDLGVGHLAPGDLLHKHIVVVVFAFHWVLRTGDW